jgi:SAM-dependent methyltransferase
MAVERRFRSTVPYYVRYRPRYPPTLLDAVAEALALDGTGRLLDLGSGPAFLAIGLAWRFEEAVAMDPEPEMIAAADAEARAAGVALTLVRGSSEDLDPDRPGPRPEAFRLVTMGRSFHWMDRERTLHALDALVTPGGSIGLFDVDHVETPENAWEAALDAVRDRFTPDSRRRRRGEQERHEAVLTRSAFSSINRVSHVWRQRVSVDDLVGRMLSMSATAPDALEVGLSELAAALHRALGPFIRDGLVEEVLEADALLASRPGKRATVGGGTLERAEEGT